MWRKTSNVRLGGGWEGDGCFLDIDYFLRCAGYGEKGGLEVDLELGWCRSLLIAHDLNFGKGSSLEGVALCQ